MKHIPLNSFLLLPLFNINIFPQNNDFAFNSFYAGWLREFRQSITSSWVFALYFWVDQGWPGCLLLSGCSAGVHPSLLQIYAQTNIKGRLQIKTLIFLNLGELLPSKLASLCIEELTVSLSCLTAARRRHKKKENQSTSQFLLEKCRTNLSTNLASTNIQ